MHSALFVVQISENRGTWLSFLAKSKAALRPFPNVSRLAENVWLVNVQESPTPLGYLVCAADVLGVSYGILPFQDAPQWLPVDFDPSTIWVHNEETYP